MKQIVHYIILLLIFLPCCISKRSSTYVIPEHYAPEVKALYLERATKGRALYKAYCAECHGIFSKGKDGVPNFTSTQIDNYHATALLGIDPKNHAVAKKLSQNQVDDIIIFLRLRKPN